MLSMFCSMTDAWKMLPPPTNRIKFLAAVWTFNPRYLICHILFVSAAQHQFWYHRATNRIHHCKEQQRELCMILSILLKTTMTLRQFIGAWSDRKSKFQTTWQSLLHVSVTPSFSYCLVVSTKLSQASNLHTLTCTATARTPNFFLLLFKGQSELQQRKWFCCAKMLTQQKQNQCTIGVHNKLGGLWLILKGISRHVYVCYCSNPRAIWNLDKKPTVEHPPCLQHYFQW